MSSDRQRHTGRLFVISGPSGAGKRTICKRILEDSDPSEITLSVSMTTRVPREGETEGVSYFFTDKENFREKIEEGGFLEYAQVYGNYYGTPKEYVMEKLEAGTDVILEIDIQGALNVKKAYSDAVLIFVLPPSMEVLRKRLTDRHTETEEAINMRLSETLKEMSVMDQYDYCIINDVLDDAVRAAEAVMKAEHSRATEDVCRRLVERYKEELD